MTRPQLQQYFPDTYRFFYETPDTHPFWRALEHVYIDDAKAGATLLSDLEQVFAWMHSVDGHHIVQEYITQMDTHEKLMEFLTSVYVAYLYRNHGSRLLHTPEHGYNVELEIADQLLALGIVAFQNFDAPRLQFSSQIEDEMEHLLMVKNESPEHNETTEMKDFFTHLQDTAGDMKEHPKANHQVMAAITNYAKLPREVKVARYVKDHPEDMKKHFPHLAGVILIDPTPGKETAQFVPFHGDNHELERLLTKKN